MKESPIPLYRRLPALFMALHLLVGTLLARAPLASCSLLLVFWLPQLFPMRMRWRDWEIPAALLLIGFGWFLVSCRTITPELSPEGIQGRIEWTTQRVLVEQGRFGLAYRVRGKICAFYDQEGVNRCKGCQASFYQSARFPPPLDPTLSFQARLVEQKGNVYLKPLGPLEGGERAISLVSWRWKVTRALREWLRAHLKKKESVAFLMALLTGEVSHGASLFDLRRLGLAHLLAISGFHFSLVMMLVGLWLRLFCFPRKVRALLSLGVTIGYALLLGPFPAVLRAAIMASLTLLGRLTDREINSLNSLGVAALLILLIDPLAGHSIGFAFSFLCTAGIILLYPPLESFLKRFWGPSSSHECLQMSFLEKHGALFSGLFRRASALNGAVHLISFPLTLLFFQRVTLLSPFYNFLFPPLIAIALFFFPLLFLTQFLPSPLDHLFFSLGESLIELPLSFARNLPLTLDFRLRLADSFPAVTACWLVGLFLVAVYWKVFPVKETARRDQHI